MFSPTAHLPKPPKPLQPKAQSHPSPKPQSPKPLASPFWLLLFGFFIGFSVLHYRLFWGALPFRMSAFGLLPASLKGGFRFLISPIHLGFFGRWQSLPLSAFGSSNNHFGVSTHPFGLLPALHPSTLCRHPQKACRLTPKGLQAHPIGFGAFCLPACLHPLTLTHLIWWCGVFLPACRSCAPAPFLKR